MKSSLLTACGLLAILIAPAPADVRLPAIFSDHLVLQRGVEVPVWGWAEPGEEVSVRIGKQARTTRAGADGKWSVKLGPLAAGDGLIMEVDGRNTIKVNDVLIGEVWLGSGQSNMAMTVNRAQDYTKEEAAANRPKIRMFTVKSGAANSAQADCQGAWEICSPQTIGGFSATLYFFGCEIHRMLGVPVGLINSSVGGTPIESWISPQAQKASPELKVFFEAQEKAAQAFDEVAAKAAYEKQLATWKERAKQARVEGKVVPRAPRDPVALRARKGNVGGLFNGKIAPLIPYAMRGALWYQGEANSTPEKAPFYQHQLPLLVNDWRVRWGVELPFAWVQLPNFEGAGRDWPTIREAMLKALRVPWTGMAITIDIGDAKDIHPKNKQEVGRRLAQWALGTLYERKVATSGPLLARSERRGGEIELAFHHADGGLIARDGALRGFSIAGADQKFVPALARIEGDKVIVSAPEVSEPVAVRYAWENNPSVNLYNGAGLPASPFRTDAQP